MQGVQYFDGLGRLLQTVQVKGSPAADKDLIQPEEYDAFGRQARQYLPYASTSTNGGYRSDALNHAQSEYYAAPPAGTALISMPFSHTNYEASPLNRVTEQGAPGIPWQPAVSLIAGSGHTVRQEHGTNTATGDRSVRLYTVAVLTDGYNTGDYGAGQLFLTVTKDENWTSGKTGTTDEYTDKQGKVVLMRVWQDEVTKLSTYYVYDDLDNLRFVLPPGSNADNAVPSQDVLDKLCYRYLYDSRRRLTEKKVAGKGWEYMVYNKLDQLILSQDALQRVSGQWNFIKYNAFGAQVMQGYYAGGGISRDELQILADNHTGKLWETYTGTGGNEGYDILSFPTTIYDLRSVQYYNDYSFPGNPFVAPGNQSQKIRGMLTGTRVRAGESGSLLYTALYYDDKGRVMQSQSENHLGGTDITYNTYSFTGELESSTRSHSTPVSSVTLATRSDYDHMGRRGKTWERINGDMEVLLSEQVYNEIGQLKEKKLHNAMQTIAYGYNERGWLTSATSAKLDLQLHYNNPRRALPQYNGNISEQEYTSAHSGYRWFTYSYDGLNRLSAAAYSDNNNEMGEQLSYDQMGNITSLVRGGAGNGTLSYAYDGNRLSSVSGFKAGSYVYDANGNTTTDGVRNLSVIYNRQNLPIMVSGAGTASYTYDAAGNKLNSVQGGISRDYIGGIQYESGQISQVVTEEGRAVRNASGSYRYEYFLKDHLGNTRVVIDADANNLARVVQDDEYYAFGLNRNRYQFGEGNKYLYNGKEKQEVLSDQYDYGARFYDPVIGRWNVVDPLAEKMRGYSPYSYAFNNPIRFIDYGGLYPIEIITRSYAPYKTFGPGNNWYGDSRGASANRNASSRSSVTIRHDTETRITTAAGSSRRSHTVDGSRDAMSTTVVEENRSRGSKIDVHSAGRNEAQFGSSDIDQFTKLTANIEGNIKGNHILSISGTISGDDFPNQESIVYDSKGNSVMLGAFATSGDRQSGPVTDLPLENEGDVQMKVGLRINVDKNGVFQGVTVNENGKNKMISISNWNKRFIKDDNKK